MFLFVKKNILHFVMFVLLLGVFLYAYKCSSEKTGYVNIYKVFSDFTYKKELHKEYSEVVKLRNLHTDSLKIQLQRLYDLVQTEKNEKLRGALILKLNTDEAYYQSKAKELEEMNKELMSEYDGRIYVQLNQYVKDFGDEQGYDFILGSDGNGNIMYSKPDKDLTEEVLAYINKRYQGEK